MNEKEKEEFIEKLLIQYNLKDIPKINRIKTKIIHKEHSDLRRKHTKNYLNSLKYKKKPGKKNKKYSPRKPRKSNEKEPNSRKMLVRKIFKFLKDRKKIDIPTARIISLDLSNQILK